MKKPRPTTVEKIVAAQAAPSLSVAQVHNLVFAARRALALLPAADLQLVSSAIAQGEAVMAHHQRMVAAAVPATPTPAAPPPPPAKG
jgi:hypothetical protein